MRLSARSIDPAGRVIAEALCESLDRARAEAAHLLAVTADWDHPDSTPDSDTYRALAQRIAALDGPGEVRLPGGTVIAVAAKAAA